MQNACKRLSLSTITGHSLRGIHAGLATKAGATSELVSAQLGHTRIKVTEGCYIGLDAVADRGVANAEENLLH